MWEPCEEYMIVTNLDNPPLPVVRGNLTRHVSSLHVPPKNRWTFCERMYSQPQLIRPSLISYLQ